MRDVLSCDLVDSSVCAAESDRALPLALPLERFIAVARKFADFLKSFASTLPITQAAYRYMSRYLSELFLASADNSTRRITVSLYPRNGYSQERIG